MPGSTSETTTRAMWPPGRSSAWPRPGSAPAPSVPTWPPSTTGSVSGWALDGSSTAERPGAGPARAGPAPPGRPDHDAQEVEIEGVPEAVTWKVSHMPASSCPGTRQAIRKVPVRSGVKEKVWVPPAGTPLVGLGEVAPGKTGVVELAPDTIEQECGIEPWLRQFTVTFHPTGTLTVILPSV